MKVKKHLSNIQRYDTAHLDRLKMVRLDRNERVNPWPVKVWHEIQSIITPELLMSYPEISSLYDKIAGHLNLSRQQLLLSHGSDVALKTIFETYIGHGDEAVLLNPSYAMYPVYAQMVDARAIEVSFLKDLSLPFEMVLNAITDRTRIVCLPNPNQPIERIFTRAELEEIMELALKKDFLLVIDEAYHYFYAGTVVDDIRRNTNLIVTRTFSKAFGIAGLRAGLIISSEERISDLKKVKPISEINGVAVKLIEFFLDRMDIIKNYINEVDKGREVIQKRASLLGIQTHGCTGNSILLQMSSVDEVNSLVITAKEEGYLIKGSLPYPAEKCIRITLGPEKYMEKIMDIIERSLQC
jgi:histidinol-phosphate aminotransferase